MGYNHPVARAGTRKPPTLVDINALQTVTANSTAKQLKNGTKGFCKATYIECKKNTKNTPTVPQKISTYPVIIIFSASFLKQTHNDIRTRQSY